MDPATLEIRGGAIDTVELSRIERLLQATPPEDLTKLYSEEELRDAGEGPGRIASLAARFAAKEAACKLFSRELSLGLVAPSDFSVVKDAYGASEIGATPKARALMDLYRIKRVKVSLTHTGNSASALVWAEARQMKVPWYGTFMFRAFPIRGKVVLKNLRRVFSDVLPKEEIEQIAAAFYGHYLLFFLEFIRLRLMTRAQREKWVRIENAEGLRNALDLGKGVLLLTGHFGNWEVSTVAGIAQFPEAKGKFHFVRRPFKPKWLYDMVTRRFRKSGFGTLTKRDSLDRILKLLSEGAVIVFILDQNASMKDGVLVDFLGHPAVTFKSLALLAMTTGAPVVPASSWREEDGSHVLRFENALPLLHHKNAGEEIKLNTRAYNEALEQAVLRHPEQWIWMHKRWKHMDRE